MKWITSALICLSLAGCSINGLEDKAREEVVIRLCDDSIVSETRTKSVSALEFLPPSLYWEGTVGTWKSETSVQYASTLSAVNTGTISTGLYQTSTPTAYNWYVSNNAITFASGGSTIAASNNLDVIAGCTKGASATTTPSVVLDHVFARTGNLTCNTQTGYTITGVSWKIQSKTGTGGTSGTYNIATQEWSELTALSEQSFTATDDLYLVPGDYKVTVTYTLNKDDYHEEFVKYGSVTLIAGKINDISCTAVGGSAQEISMGVSLTAWTDNVCNMTFEN